VGENRAEGKNTAWGWTQREVKKREVGAKQGKEEPRSVLKTAELTQA
jgi:hypothetical protein